jgi:hypothetical protein
MHLHQIYSAIKYVSVTEGRNAQAVDCQGQMDNLLPSLDQLEVPQISF